MGEDLGAKVGAVVKAGGVDVGLHQGAELPTPPRRRSLRWGERGGRGHRAAPRRPGHRRRLLRCVCGASGQQAPTPRRARRAQSRGTIHIRGVKPSMAFAVSWVQNEPCTAPAVTRGIADTDHPEGEDREGEQDRPGRGRRCPSRGAARRELHRCRPGIRVAVLSGGGAVGTGDGGAHSTVRVFEVVVCCTMVATATSTASTVSPASSWSSSVTLLRTAAVTSGIDRGLIICRVPRR